MGHINFAQFMIDRKGITDRVTLNGMTLMNWQTSLLPMDEPFVDKYRPILKNNEEMPCNFFIGNFNLAQTGEVYFDMSAYEKGMVYINGQLLGRYWNIGPQQRLYCPASWLKKGQNKIVVFDLHKTKASPVKGLGTLE